MSGPYVGSKFKCSTVVFLCHTKLSLLNSNDSDLCTVRIIGAEFNFWASLLRPLWEKYESIFAPFTVQNNKETKSLKSDECLRPEDILIPNLQLAKR